MTPILGTIASSYLKSAAAFESIASTTLTSNTTNVVFTSIPQTYKHLQIRTNLRLQNGISGVGILQLNEDSTTTNYAIHWLSGAPHVSTSTIEVSQDVGNYNGWLFGAHAAGGENVSNYFSGSIIEIYDYTNTSKFKTGKGLTGFASNAGSETSIRNWGGLYRSTNAITAIRFFNNNNAFVTNSVFALYGIKG